MTDLTHYTEGVCADGAAILRDGVMMPIEEIVSELNRLTALAHPAPLEGDKELLKLRRQPMITKEELELHAKWIRGESDGVRLVKVGAVLTGAFLTHAVLTRAVLTRAVLIDADLTGAVLTGADLAHAVLTGAVLTGADLTDADLTRAVLTGADLTRAVLTGAVLARAVLIDADLTRAVLTRAVLAHAVLTGAVLTGADLTGADLTRAVLTGADLTRAVLTRAVLTRAVLIDADLTRAVLALAVLTLAVGLPIAADAADRLKAVAAAALQPNALEMSSWHECGTTHCIAGWAIHLAGEPGRLMESMMGAEVAGLLLLGPAAHQHFHDSNEGALEYLRKVGP